MDEGEDHTTHEAYIQGRLEGLNQLVLILKTAIEEKPAPEAAGVVRSIVVHIAQEMESIITSMKEVHGENPIFTATAAKSRKMSGEAAKVESEGAPAEMALKKQVVATEELMKRLLELQKQTAGAKAVAEEKEE